MVKFTKIIKKNLKLLLRAKSSAFIVMFGPLIIILLVGLALNKPSTYDISVSYYTPDSNNTLTNSFIQGLSTNNYQVVAHLTNSSCIESIKQGTSHTCMIFPENFEAGNEDFNTLQFYVDYSRANIVYQIIDTVSSNIDVTTTELSKDFTGVLLTRISETKKDIDKNILSIITIKSTIDSISSSVQTTKSNSKALNFSTSSISLGDIKSKGSALYADAKDLKDEAEDALAEGKALAGGNFTSTLSTINDNVEDIFNTTPEVYDEFVDLVNNATDQVDELEDNLKEGNKKNKEIQSELDDVTGFLTSLKGDADDLKSQLESSNTNLKNIDLVSAESIVTPIKTEIKPILTDTNQLLSFFPSLLVLVLMFIGIMLSSSMIVMEKNSKAAFRNFTTPTKPRYFVFTTYITSLIILLTQTIIILALSYSFLKGNLFSNLGLTTFVIFIAMSIFILIGMSIGYVTSTQEAATMLSITLGSVFLLLSNLVLPIETMSDFIKNLTRFNPYVVSSELLKKTFLFDLKLTDAINEVLFLIGFLVVMIIIVFSVNKLSRLRLLEKSPHIQAKKGYIYVPEDSYLKIGKYIIKNKEDIELVLNTMSNEEFNKHVKKKNEIADWVSMTLKDRKLAWRLRYKSREKMINIMNKHFHKEQKEEEKGSEKKEKK